MLTDFRFALRQLFKSPGFTLLAVITLTLGIGLNTTIFSLINELFLRGLPFKESSRVVRFYSGTKSAKALEWPISAPRFQLYRDAQTIFDGFAAGARANVHAKVLYGRSSHHHIEAVFKAFARALRVACAKDKRLAKMLPSTKGLL